MKHENYEILNLIGYGLSKFNNSFIEEFGFKTKTDFYTFCVDNKIADTASVIKNRMDLFDPFFPENGRKGWWQKGNTYIHRKILIDNLFGQEDIHTFANSVKLYLNKNYKVEFTFLKTDPIQKSRFKKLQETGLEAEIYFMNNFEEINIFKNCKLEDARLFGDGYDFQISNTRCSYLAEVKGIRDSKGKFRMTENEYNKAVEYGKDYIVTVVLNLNNKPKFLLIDNPIQNLDFEEKIIRSKISKEYHLKNVIC
jgi:hypothetical protein